MKTDDGRHVVGELRNWYPILVAEKDIIICGRIYNDFKNRFKDGTLIQTSALIFGEQEIKEGGVVQTLNSNYLLGEKMKDVPDIALPTL